MALSLFHLLLLLVLFPKLGAGSRDECKVRRCGNHGPPIRFPFWLKDLHPESCGYPREFELSCNHENQTVLELPFSVKLMVKKIDYRSQVIQLYDPNACLPRQLPKLNLSASPFHFQLIGYDFLVVFALFNCSAPDKYLRYSVPCLSVPGYQIFAISFYQDSMDLTSCVKMYNISSVPDYMFGPSYQNKRDYHKDLWLTWSEPNCTKCEAQGKICSMNNTRTSTNNHTTAQLECQDMPKTTTKGATRKLMIAGLASGVILFALVVIGIYCAYTSQKIQKEDQIMIEIFLENYKALKPTRYTFADIKKITNQFKDKLGEGGYGTVFKGKLSNDIFVAVKLLSSSIGNGDEFINEVGTMGLIHHVNVVRLVGFCADGIRRALVYEFLPNDSLEKFIFSENHNTNSLGWEKLQDIALGIAKGIEYLHQGCDQRILHFDIKPHNILLDHNFNPKIADFGLAKLCSKEQSIVSMTAARGTMGYIAPEVFSRNFGNVSYKSDVYSFGMLLLEMVGGRKNIDVTVQNTSQTYFPEWIYNRLCRGEDIWIQINEHAHIAKTMAVVGLWCIQWYPTDRPSMKTVVQMLEGKGDSLTIPPNPFSSTVQMESSIRSARAFNLAVISEAE